MIGISNTKLLLSTNIASVNSSGFCDLASTTEYELVVANKGDLLNENDTLQSHILDSNYIVRPQDGTVSLVPIKSNGNDSALCLISVNHSISPYLWVYSLAEQKGGKMNVNQSSPILLKNVTFVAR